MRQQARGKLPWACGTSRFMFEMITADIWSSLCLCRPVLQTPPPINCLILSKTLLQIYFISSPGRGEVGDCKEQKETCTNRSMPESTQTEGKDSHARRRCRVGSVLWNRLTERTPWLCPRPRTPKDCLTVENEPDCPPFLDWRLHQSIWGWSTGDRRKLEDLERWDCVSTQLACYRCLFTGKCQ